ncbi:MAG TPA: hypothetical protein VFF67_02905 [Thermoplasmata archaeon]|nr:hypothetical protein [Thermoplasmata archaeon]
MDVSAFTNAAFAGIAVLGFVLTGLALLAVRRAPSPRMALVASGFGLVAVEGVVVSFGLLVAGWDAVTLLLVTAILQAIVLLALFAATLLR